MGSEEVRLMLTDILEATEPGDFVTTHGVSGSEKEGKEGGKEDGGNKRGDEKGEEKRTKIEKERFLVRGFTKKNFFETRLVYPLAPFIYHR